MNATEKQYVEKLKDIKESFSNLSNRYYIWSSMAVIYKQDLDPLIAILESEISALEQQLSEPDDELREKLLKFLEWFRIEVCTEDIPIEDEYFVDKFLSIRSKMP